MPVKLVAAGHLEGLAAFALRELGNYADRLFVAGEWETLIHVYLQNRLPPELIHTVGRELPALSQQGFYLRRLSDTSFLILGGSDIAVLWAVYELAERWGVVHTLHEDVFPCGKTGLWLPDVDKAYEPRQKSRSWRVMNTLLHGPEGWSLRQHRQFIAQLARQKYNGILISIWPQHPFIDFKINGVSKKKGYFHFGMEIPVTADNIGREFLGSGGSFTSPEFQDCVSFEEMYERGRAYISEIISCAKFFGMRVEMAINIFDLPQEYAVLLEKPSDVKQFGALTVAETGDILGKNHIGILRQVFETYLSTYPDVDIFEINLPEHARDMLGFGEAWASLDKRFGLSGRYDIEKLICDPTYNHLAYGGPQRAQDEGRMTFVLLEMLHRLFDATGIFTTAQGLGKKLAVQAGLSCPAIMPAVSEALWPDAHLNIVLGYTASRSARCLNAVDRLNTGKVTVEQIVTLQDDNIGPLPQIATRSIGRLVDFGAEHGWNGFLTRFWPIGDLGPVSHYLAKASWEQTDVQRAYAGYISGMCGAKAVAPMSAALHLLEDATLIMDLNHLCFMFPAGGIMCGNVGKGNTALMDESLWHVKAIYDEVFTILSKLLTDAPLKGKGREEAAYFSARVEFARSILEGIRLLEQGNGAAGHDGAGASYREAVACFEKGLNALAGNVRDDSDIAVLAIYYHLLVRETKLRTEEYENDGGE